LFFSGARLSVGGQLAALGLRAAEKQNGKGWVGVAFYKQATTNVVDTAKGKFALPVIAVLIVFARSTF